MERSGNTQPSGVRTADLVDLGTRAGPFATIWMSTPLAVGGQVPGASVRVVPSSIVTRIGLGAILRWSEDMN